ncbi:hypothetical protein JYU18_01160 [bacterium AH-315-E07]|nr:hypothetical protein [bacterium AH-315-E07]
MSFKYIFTLGAAIALLPQISYADTSLGLGLGTLGGKIQLGQSLTKNTNFRLEYNVANYDGDGETDGVDYDVDLELNSFGLLFDWHAFGNGFRVTLGGLINDNRLSARSNINGDVEVGDVTFTSAQVGQLRGDVTFDSFAPYLGLGWGRAVTKGWNFIADVGVAFQGSAEANLRSEGGTLSNNPILLNEIDREERELQNDLDGFEVYPVLSLGINYTF